MITDIEVCDLKDFTVNACCNEFRKAIGYFVDGVLVGYLIYDLIYDRIEIVDIFVKNDMRSRKIGTNMLKYLVDFARSRNCVNITLEVRKSNLPAIGLYLKCGFVQKAIRCGYYDGEDGILMELIL